MNCRFQNGSGRQAGLDCLAAALLLIQALMVAPEAGASDPQRAGFGGAPPLGPRDSLRRQLAPYDLVKLNVLGANYCENLLDLRLNITSYTHLDADIPSRDGWHLQFPDDSARFLESLAWEDQFSPVVRLETARRLVKGLLAARVPGARSDSFFRHRTGGKTYVIFGDSPGAGGRALLSMLGDETSGMTKVGFRTRQGADWIGMDRFACVDPPGGNGNASQARSDRNWNAAPVAVRRYYTTNNVRVDFTGRYWMSDEDRPLEFGFAATGGDRLQVVVGEPGRPMPLLGEAGLPATIHLPDRQTTFRSDADGDRTFDQPAFRWLVLSKPGAALSAGYSSALLVLWEGQPERVEALSAGGYGELRITFPGASGRVWLYPYPWLNARDIGMVFRSAEQFLDHGTLLQNGFPSQQHLNAIPAGLAAGAYLLSRYHDPLADTALANARRAVDDLFQSEDEGQKLLRVFFTVRAAAWMVKAAKERGDSALASRYEALLDRAMPRLCSAATGYDGRAWPGGWDHFNAVKSCWHAFDATGRQEYLDAFDRALPVYTIDEKGIYREGRKLDAPGGFDTYSGTLPLAVWGIAGKLDWVRQLIHLEVPNGWNAPATPLSKVWNDAGAGPWAQDDANPEFLGISLRGAQVPQPRKYILPTGAFPTYDATGKVTVTRRPMLDNPFFLPGIEPPRIVDASRLPAGPAVRATVLVPGTALERRRLVQASGTVREGRRICASQDGPLVYRFDTGKADGLGLDLRIRGEGYQVEVSPDGQRWLKRLDTWDRDMADPSLDLSFLAGSREELVPLVRLTPPADAQCLVDPSGSAVERDHCRIAQPGGAFIYRLNLPGAAGCWLELFVGNGYEVSLSAEGKRWSSVAASTDPDGGSGKAGTDAAVIRLVDASACLRGGASVFVRVSDQGNRSAFDGRPAFLRRLTAYGMYRSGRVWVRLSNVPGPSEKSFTLERLALRQWRNAAKP